MRKVSVILALMIMLSIFTACEKGNAKKVEKADFFKPEAVTLTENGNPLYTIVKSENASKEVSDAVSELFRKIKKQFGSCKTVETDITDDTNKCEIIVGKTKREASVNSFEYLRENGGLYKDDFLIMSVGKKIVIIGVDDASTVEAVKYFNENYVSGETYEKGIFYRKYTSLPKVNSPLINGVPILKFALVRPHYNSSYITQIEIDKLADYIEETTGCILQETEDTYEDEQTYEIIVGNSARNGVKEITDRYCFDVRIEETKVYLNGGHNFSTAAAVTEFLNMVKKGNVTDADSMTGDYNTAKEGYDLSTQYTPTWSDDFNGISLDPYKWRVINGAAEKGIDRPTVRSDDPSVTGVENGLFYIRPKKDDDYYYGGKIQSDYRMSFLYGFVEISEKIPNMPGMWTAFWTGSTDSKNTMYLSPGVDIHESYGNGYITEATCHIWPVNNSPLNKGRNIPHYVISDADYGNDIRGCLDGRSFNDDFHTLGMLWTDKEVTFTCDGKIYSTHYTDKNENDHEAYTDHSMYLKLSMIVGDQAYGADVVRLTEEDWNSEERCLYADHIYLYQLQDGKSKLKR